MVSITCFAIVLDTFVTRPVIIWQGPGGQAVDNETLQNGLTSPGEYSCLACVTVESVNIRNHCSTTSVSISYEGECDCRVIIQVSFDGVYNCMCF